VEQKNIEETMNENSANLTKSLKVLYPKSPANPKQDKRKQSHTEVHQSGKN
jgi:hypothetical protein